jgi:hypothetical protein
MAKESENQKLKTSWFREPEHKRSFWQVSILEEFSFLTAF